MISASVKLWLPSGKTSSMVMSSNQRVMIFPPPCGDFAAGRLKDGRSLQWSDRRQEGHESYARMASLAGVGWGEPQTLELVAHPHPRSLPARGREAPTLRR